jgi:hypothetical protein
MRMVVLAVALMLTACGKAPESAEASKAAGPVAAVPDTTPAPSPLPDGPLPDLKGQLYDQARATLLAQAFEPVVFPCTANDGLCHSRAELIAKYPEVVDCAGTGVSPCALAWRKGERYFLVHTYGEESLHFQAMEATTRAEIEKDRFSRPTTD